MPAARATSRRLSVANPRLALSRKAALTIAHLAPSHLKDQRIRELLFRTLAIQELGAAAGMVLGASTDLDIQDRLNELAAGDKSPAQQRASLAISTRRADQGEQL